MVVLLERDTATARPHWELFFFSDLIDGRRRRITDDWARVPIVSILLPLSDTTKMEGVTGGWAQ